MDAANLRRQCLQLPGTTEDIKWDDHLCFCVGDKMFLIMNPDKVPVSVSFKASAETFDELVSRPRFAPAPYLARYKWVFSENINILSED